MKVDPVFALEVLNTLVGSTVKDNTIILPNDHSYLVYDHIKMLFKSYGGKPLKKGATTFLFLKGGDTQAVLDEIIAAAKDDVPAEPLTEKEKSLANALIPQDGERPAGDADGAGKVVSMDGKPVEEQPTEEATKEDPKPVRDHKTLKYVFSDKEAHELALDLAQENKKLQMLEQDKASVVAQYGGKIKECKARLNRISQLVADGHEHRDVEVEITFNVPSPGMKTVKRLDTNEEIVEKMDQMEFNLFNQPGNEPVITHSDFVDLGV